MLSWIRLGTIFRFMMGAPLDLSMHPASLSLCPSRCARSKCARETTIFSRCVCLPFVIFFCVLQADLVQQHLQAQSKLQRFLAAHLRIQADLQRLAASPGQTTL